MPKKAEYIHMRIDEELKQRIGERAKSRHMTSTAWIRAAIVEKLDRDK